MLASATGALTGFVGDHGVYAVFTLMLAAGVVPAASELVMLYAGAVAAGTFASQHVVVFGDRVSSRGWALVAVAIAGILGNTVGALVGWGIGSLGGRPLLERHGRWIHVTPAKLDRAHRAFERRGAIAVAFLFAVPALRSFVAIPAGIVRMSLRSFLPFAALGCTVFCFGFAGGGWALGNSYDRIHGDVRYLYVAMAGAVVAAAAYVFLRRRSSRLPRRA